MDPKRKHSVYTEEEATSAEKLPVDTRAPRKKPQFPELEQKVYSVYRQRLDQGKPTRYLDIRKIALQVAADLKMQEFKASNGWIQTWKEMFKVTSRAYIKGGRKPEQTEEDKDPKRNLRKHAVYTEEEAKRYLESYLSSKLSQKAFAKSSGISASTLSDWAAGKLPVATRARGRKPRSTIVYSSASTMSEKASQAIFVRNKCGNFAIVDNEYMFRIKIKKPHVQYWRCRKMWNTGSSQATTKAKKPTGCHSVLTMDMDGFIKAHTAHNHPPNLAEVETAIEAAKTFEPAEPADPNVPKPHKRPHRKREYSDDEPIPESVRKMRLTLATKMEEQERAETQTESLIAVQELQDGKSFSEVAALLGYSKTPAPILPTEDQTVFPPPKPSDQIKRQQEDRNKIQNGQNEVLVRYVTQMSYDTAGQISDTLCNLGILNLEARHVSRRLRKLGFERVTEEDDATGEPRQRWQQTVAEAPEKTEAVIVTAEEQMCNTTKLLPSEPCMAKTTKTAGLPLLTKVPIGQTRTKTVVVALCPFSRPTSPEAHDTLISAICYLDSQQTFLPE